MAMVNVLAGTVAASLGGSVAEADWLGPKVGGRPALVLYSSNEPGAQFTDIDIRFILG